MRKVLYDTSLTPLERMTMMYLYSLENENVEISIKELCELINCSNKTIIKALKRLEETNYLKINKRGQGKNNIYTINYNRGN
jgi:Mn-dependent DtxR family transcriptional regulator